jgi:hypothetical protein
MKKFKNNKGSTDTWCGQSIAAAAYYEIPATELHKWQNDSKVLTDLGSGDGKMNNGTSDYTDAALAINFLKDTAPLDSDGIPLVRTRAFANPDNMKFRGTGISATCTKNTTTNVDYKLTENRYLNGIQIIVKDHVIGDKVQLKVIDIDNILGYGANTVLDQFGKDWFMVEDQQNQGIIQLAYAALVLLNLYIRVEYVSVGTVTDVTFKANLFLHKK